MQRLRLPWPALLVLAACLPSESEPSEPRESHAQQAAPFFGEQPRLLSREVIPDDLPRGDAGVAAPVFTYELYLPQADGRRLRVPVAGCDPVSLQNLLGVWEVDPIANLTRDEVDALNGFEQARWTFRCPAPKPIAAQPQGQDTWLAKFSADAATLDGGTSVAGELVLAIPKRCVDLIEHFHVTDREATRSGAAQAPWAVDLAVNCESGRPPTTTDFVARVVLAGSTTPLIEIVNGDSRIYLSRVDGMVPSTDQAADRPILERLRALLQVGPDPRSGRLLRPALPDVAFDLCTTQCEKFVPSHLRKKATGGLGCLGDEAAPLDMKVRACPKRPAELALREHMAVHGALVQDVAYAADPALRAPRFEACGGRASWAPYLGLTVDKSTADVLTEAVALYQAPAIAPAMPCVRNNSCTIAVGAGKDLSSVELQETLKKGCWPPDDKENLTIALGGNVTATGSLALVASQLPFQTVRIVGPANKANITAPARTCGSSLCQNETPIVSVRGPLRLEVEGVNFVATRGADNRTSRPPPGNRIAIEASEGSTVVVRHTQIGVPLVPVVKDDGARQPEEELPLYLYTGIRATNATVYLYNSDVRVFATALDMRSSRLAVLGNSVSAERLLLRVLESRTEYADLMGLELGSDGKNRMSLQPRRYAALSLSGSGAKAFLGRVKMVAPVGVAYSAFGTRARDLQIVNAEIGWDPGCNLTLFRSESCAVDVSGNGDLRFEAVDVLGFGDLLRCSAPALVQFGRGELDATTSVFRRIAYRLDPGQCRVSTDFDVRADPCTN